MSKNQGNLNKDEESCTGKEDTESGLRESGRREAGLCDTPTAVGGRRYHSWFTDAEYEDWNAEVDCPGKRVDLKFRCIWYQNLCWLIWESLFKF